jgi:hypothetical protein
MPTLEEIRTELEALHTELGRENHAVRSGLKGAQAAASVLSRHPLVAERATVEQLRGLLREAQGEERALLRRLFFGCVEAHVQRLLAPLDDAAAFVLAGSGVRVNGEFVHYFDITPWLQRQDSLEARAELARGMERVYQATNPLLARLLTDEDRLLRSLGFGGYLGWCRAKKGLGYSEALPRLKESLSRTAPLYFERMEAWVGAEYGRPLSQLSRFDCIHLLRLKGFDHLFPPAGLKRVPALLGRMGLEVNHPHIRLDLSVHRRKNPQAVCLGVRIPEEIHLVLKPQGGLLDAETLLHELGHALSLAHFGPRLPFEYRYLPANRGLSEAFAFLLQGLLGSEPFLSALGLSGAEASVLRRMKRLKDLALWRRYAAKLTSEVRMWEAGGPGDGALYGATLTRHTGFRYEPAGYLADLEPEFYAADYLRAWMAEAQLAALLEREFGEGWPLDPRSGELLRSLWREGERHTLERVLERLGLSPFDTGTLERRFQTDLA